MSSWRPFGKFAVGYVDIGWLGSKVVSPESVETLHLSARLYYPSDAPSRRGWGWLRGGVAWLPGYNYASGLSRFLFFRARGLLYTVLKHLMTALAYVVCSTQTMDFHPGAPLAADAGPYPVVVFSHGLGGHRSMYSVLCSELASQGYVVLAVEHADGSASTCKLAGHKGWRFYKGLGGEEGQVQKTRVRVAEMQTALHVLKALQRGDALPGLELSHGADPVKLMRGTLDLNCLAAVGHSYGGATTATLVAEDPVWRCGVALDPWWYAVPPEAAALSRWRTQAALLVMGSHDWNVPNGAGTLSCGEGRQEAILKAAKARSGGDTAAGGGAMLLVIAGTSHNTFADPLPLFGNKLGWLMDKLGLASRLDPVLGIHLISVSTLNFLSMHLPLSAKQRALQTWEPSKGHSALDRIKQRTEADRAGSGLLARFLPAGKGFIDSMSDNVLHRVLKFTVQREWSPPDRSKAGGGGVSSTDGVSNATGESLDDVVTASEVLELLPSADPASGPNPHAPSQAPLWPHEPHSPSPSWKSDKQGMLAMIGTAYSVAVQAGEAEEYRTLLGDEHIFKCEVHV